MTALFYLLDQLKEEGHKVLVFSQFVTMLDLIKDRLEEEERPFHYLTGQSQNRQEIVSDFQQTDDPSVFLLSLKAGGSGLNEAKIFDRSNKYATVGTVAGLSRGVYSLDFNHNGTKFCVAGGDTTIRLFNIESV